jgi:hypothetical protein
MDLFDYIYVYGMVNYCLTDELNVMGNTKSWVFPVIAKSLTKSIIDFPLPPNIREILKKINQ